MIRRRSTHKREGFLFRLVILGTVLFVALLILLPLLALLVYADPARQLALLERDAVFLALRVTLITSLTATLLIVLTGLPTAFAVSRFSGPWRRTVDLLLELPMVLPPLAAGLALLLAFGRNGLVGRLLYLWGVQIPFSMAAVVIAIVFVLIPFFIRRAAVLFDGVERELEEAGQLLGGRPFFVFRHVTLPLCGRPLLAETIMIFLQSVGLFGAVILFAGNIPGRTRTLTLAIFDAFESHPDTAFALAALLLLISAALLLAGRLLLRNIDRSRLP